MDRVLILDFGSQYTMLIARRVRELNVYSEIHPCTMPVQDIRDFNPKAIILSGGPASVTDQGAPDCPPEVFEMGLPVLGICYGLQLMAHKLGGEVEKSGHREYGQAMLFMHESRDLFQGIEPGEVASDPGPGIHHDSGEDQGGIKVWMSHGDRIKKIPPGFEVRAHTHNCPVAAMINREKKLYAVQFHPEVAHTPRGKEILKNFLFNMAGCRADWTMQSFIEQALQSIRDQVGDDKVIMGLSGGVDSSVAAMLIHRAVGDQLTCIFVDNGLLREGEADSVVEVFREHFHLKLVSVDASDEFLTALEEVVDPEEKRKRVGNAFIRVFEREAKKIPGVKHLGQGTLYPDVIESMSFRGPSATIKSHHNVGGLPERMDLSLVEPLRELFKDEVRKVGVELGLPEPIVMRQPFPGPGLSVRVLGEVTKKRLDMLRKADAITTSEIYDWDKEHTVWQYFTVLLPVQTVGVMGDERTYEYVAAVRAVKSLDGMTADWADLPCPLLARIANRIINEVKGINRVVYDISSKPPSTIEWE